MSGFVPGDDAGTGGVSSFSGVSAEEFASATALSEAFFPEVCGFSVEFVTGLTPGVANLETGVFPPSHTTI